MATAEMRSTRVSASESEQLIADLADVIHRGSRHGAGPCHGDNDGCGGGPDPADLELAEAALDGVLSELGMSHP